jgi:hypothetical protein
MRHIVYTCPGGTVSVCHPAPEFIDGWLSHGGYWRDKPRGWADAWVERRTAEGRQGWAVARFARMVQVGGCSTAEALAMIRDFDCAHLGTGHELWDASNLPDRWFRDAWRRSHNGGPIFVDLKAARPIQFRRIRTAVERENKRRAADIDLFDRLIEVPLGTIRDRIYRATTPEELRRVWPEEITPNAR